MLERFRRCRAAEVLAAGIALNVATTVTSWVLWEQLRRRRGVVERVRPPSRRDLGLTATTTAVNAGALVPAWWLWREGHIELAPNRPGRSLVDFAYLAAGVETSMYLLHRTFHHPRLYGLAHRVHHADDEEMSPVSLFVMHPVEPAGFALVALGLLRARRVSPAAISAFFGLNLVVGTIAHLPAAPARAEQWWDRSLGGTDLHQGHHADPDADFGFFTQGWDRLLRTRTGAGR